MPAPVKIRRVRADGGVDLIGRYDPSARVLEVTGEGFPLLRAGEHRVEGDLPWVFFEMCPSGYLGRRFARAFAHLRLPSDASNWRAEQVLRALAEAGHDLAGNLVIGEESYGRFLRAFGRGRAPGPSRDVAPACFARLAEDTLNVVDEGSSLGGERPKFLLRLGDHGGWMVKFSPPLDTPQGQRWADILRTELHAAEVLRAHGIEAVRGQMFALGGRAFLAIERFDRVPRTGGRRGAVTWYWIGGARYGAYDPIEIADALRGDGWIDRDDHARFRRAHAFAAVMGNNDAHAGNYALTIADDGAHALAPLYDLAPMALAPRHDELPDARLQPWPEARDDDARAMLLDLEGRIARDAAISRSFLALWRRGAAASLR